MTSIIKADNGAVSGITGITTTADNTGTLELQATSGLVSMANVTGALTVPTGTTAQRPSSPVEGHIRYNSTLSILEAYVNGAWAAITVVYPPANTVAPVISGDPSVGSTLSSTTGTWTNSPTSFAYQWFSGASPISGATSSTFVITITQNGTNITCQVTASNAGGRTTATSNSLGPVTNTYSATQLTIAGGGGGGPDSGGGGGAGGYLTGTITLTGGSVYTATVGSGGGNGSPGSNSVLSGSGITTVTSVGGGNGNGGNGGSGGGAYWISVGGFGTGTSGQGFNGGNSDGNIGGAGGGGGSSGAGGLRSGGSSTNNSITGSSVAYAGGGGGGNDGSGGGAGAGNGGPVFGNGGGATFYGSGGGGGGSGSRPGGSGFQGVVILSVPTAKYSGTTTGSPTVTTSGSNTIMTFVSSGTYTA